MAPDLRIDYSSPTHSRNRLSLLRDASRPRHAGPMVRFCMPDALKLPATAWPIAVMAMMLTAACGRVSLISRDPFDGGYGGRLRVRRRREYERASLRRSSVRSDADLLASSTGRASNRQAPRPAARSPRCSRGEHCRGREPVARTRTARRLSSASPLWAVSALGLVSSKTTAAPARADHGAVAMVSVTRMFRWPCRKGVNRQRIQRRSAKCERRVSDPSQALSDTRTERSVVAP